VTSESGRNRREQELEPLDGEQDNRDSEEYRRYYREKTGMRTQDEIERIHQFYREFDVWLESIRKYR
jgi:hypothetical protein